MKRTVTTGTTNGTGIGTGTVIANVSGISEGIGIVIDRASVTEIECVITNIASVSGTRKRFVAKATVNRGTANPVMAGMRELAAGTKQDTIIITLAVRTTASTVIHRARGEASEYHHLRLRPNGVLHNRLRCHRHLHRKSFGTNRSRKPHQFRRPIRVAATAPGRSWTMANCGIRKRLPRVLVRKRPPPNRPLRRCPHPQRQHRTIRRNR